MHFPAGALHLLVKSPAALCNLMEAITIAEPDTQENLELINRYIQEKKRGLSAGRKQKIRYSLNTLGSTVFKKQFRKVAIDEIEEVVDQIRKNDLDREYAQSTRVDFLKISKPFFAWLYPEDPKFVSWLRTGAISPPWARMIFSLPKKWKECETSASLLGIRRCTKISTNRPRVRKNSCIVQIRYWL